MLQKSKRVLEAKSKFYDRMSRAGGALNSDENCLVMFNRKKQEGPRGRYVSSSSSSSSASSDSEDEAQDGDWVEYTDCLGRTRKCLKEDLAAAKQRDRELAKSVNPAAPVPEHAFVSARLGFYVNINNNPPFTQPGRTGRRSSRPMVRGQLRRIVGDGRRQSSGVIVQR